MPSELGTFGAFGKLVSRGDFVRLSADAASFSHFDAWLTQNVEWANARAGAGWPEAFGAGPIQAFAVQTNGNGNTFLIGAFGPSSDQAGRQFPLCVAAPFVASAELTRAPHVLPLVLESVWQQAGELLVALKTAADSVTPQFGMARAMLTHTSEAHSEYGVWTSELSCGELFRLVFGDNFGDRPERVLRFISEAVKPVRGVEHSKSPLSLRLPLGDAGGAAVCFWLHVVRTLTRWQTTIPSFFWSHNGTTAELMLHLGTPPVSTLAELWLPTDRRDEFCDLRAPLSDSVTQTLAALSPQVREQLGANRSLSQLLRALEGSS